MGLLYLLGVYNFIVAPFKRLYNVCHANVGLIVRFYKLLIKMKNNTKGFTLIELLVVIAIIGILSSVVLASLNTARGKGSDAAVKSNLANIRAQAELVYDADGDYAGVCTDANVISMRDAASQAGAGDTTSDVCNDSDTEWAASAPLKVQNQVDSSSGVDYWCVDSTGVSKIETSALGTATACS